MDVERGAEFGREACRRRDGGRGEEGVYHKLQGTSWFTGPFNFVKTQICVTPPVNALRATEHLDPYSKSHGKQPTGKSRDANDLRPRGNASACQGRVLKRLQMPRVPPVYCFREIFMRLPQTLYWPAGPYYPEVFTQEPKKRS